MNLSAFVTRYRNVIAAAIGLLIAVNETTNLLPRDVMAHVLAVLAMLGLYSAGKSDPEPPAVLPWRKLPCVLPIAAAVLLLPSIAHAQPIVYTPPSVTKTALLPWRARIELQLKQANRQQTDPALAATLQQLAATQQQILALLQQRPGGPPGANPQMVERHYYYVPKIDVPAPGVPKVELPAPGAPKIEMPAPGSPKIELPSPGAPKIELPGPGAPKLELPGPMPPPTAYQRFTVVTTPTITRALARPVP